MWRFMESDKSMFTNNTKAGIDRVNAGGYAFLLESTMNQYTVERNCGLMQVGGLLDSKGYGIATPRGKHGCIMTTNVGSHCRMARAHCDTAGGANGVLCFQASVQ